MDELKKKESWYDKELGGWAGWLMMATVFAIICSLVKWATHGHWHWGALIGFGIGSVAFLLFSMLADSDIQF